MDRLLAYALRTYDRVNKGIEAVGVFTEADGTLWSSVYYSRKEADRDASLWHDSQIFSRRQLIEARRVA